MIALVILILCCAPVLFPMPCKISDEFGGYFHIYSTVFAPLARLSNIECLFFGIQNWVNMERVWHSSFIFSEIILSLSNVFVQSKNSKQNTEGWCYLLLTETGFFEHPMLKWLFISVIHRSFLVQRKCFNETAFILLGNSDVSFIFWTLVNIWQQMVLYPKRHVSCIP